MTSRRFSYWRRLRSLLVFAMWSGSTGCAEYEPAEDENQLSRAPDGGGERADAHVNDAASDGASSVPAGTHLLTTEEQAAWSAINRARANAPGTSPPLVPVEWDYPTSTALRKWVEECANSAPPAPSLASTIRGALEDGELVEQLLADMTDLSGYYELETNTCELGAREDCRGYTDMVQRDVKRVACAFGSKRCPAPAPTGSNQPWRSWACSYAPLPDPKVRPY